MRPLSPPELSLKPSANSPFHSSQASVLVQRMRSDTLSFISAQASKWTVWIHPFLAGWYGRNDVPVFYDPSVLDAEKVVVGGGTAWHLRVDDNKYKISLRKIANRLQRRFATGLQDIGHTGFHALDAVADG